LSLRLAGALIFFWFWEGHYEEGRGLLEAALALEGPTSALVRAKALGGASLLARRQSDLVRAKEAAEEGLRLSKEAGIEDCRALFFLGGTYRAFFLNLLANVSMDELDHGRMALLGEESLRLNRQADDLQGIISSLGVLAVAARHRGDYERADRLYAEGLSLVRKLDSAYWRFLYLTNWGWTSLLQGNYERAAALTEEAVELARGRGFMGLLQRALDNLGWAALLGGDLGRAKALFEESLVLSREVGDKDNACASLEGLASIAGAQGKVGRAARLFGAAEAWREALGASLLEPAERSMHECYLVGARSQTHQLTWAEAWEEGWTMSMEEAIGYALSEQEPSATPAASEQPPVSAPEYPAGLTAREAEVLRLVAGGLTNAQVAGKLFLSRRTVDTHLTSVYRKLGVSSRAAAIRFALEQGLA
jgi:DNA-binding CsgD family transcriptional regulator/tetratricopeptide (TPR) repeat protein